MEGRGSDFAKLAVLGVRGAGLVERFFLRRWGSGISGFYLWESLRWGVEEGEGGSRTERGCWGCVRGSLFLGKADGLRGRERLPFFFFFFGGGGFGFF